MTNLLCEMLQSGDLNLPNYGLGKEVVFGVLIIAVSLVVVVVMVL